MKPKLRCTLGSLRFKPPNYLFELIGVVIGAKRLGGVILDGKPVFENKPLIQAFRGLNAVHSEVQQLGTTIGRLGNEIAAGSKKQAVRLDDPRLILAAAIAISKRNGPRSPSVTASATF